MSQTLSSTYGDNLLVLGAHVIIGTAQIGQDYGCVKSASVKRSADKQELEDGAGNLRSLVLTKPGFELMLEVAFEKHVTAPAMLTQIALPLIGVQGRVMPGAEVKWENGKERGLSIPVNSWDSLADAEAFSVATETMTYTGLDDESAPFTFDSEVSTFDSELLTWDAA